MVKEAKKDIEKKAPADLPARVSGKAPAGMEEVDMQQDVIMPRVAILQGLSQMIVDGKGNVGDLADSLSKENLGKELIFIPVFLFKTRVMFEVGKGLVMMSRNGLTISQASTEYQDKIGKSCDDLPEAQWDGSNPPKLSLVYNFPAIKVGRENEFPISISLMRTSAKAGKTLISLAAMSGEDMFARKYKLTTSVEKNDKGTYAIAHVELVGRCSDEEYAVGKKWYQSLRGRKIDVDMDEENPNFEE